MEKRERIIELARNGHPPNEIFSMLQIEFGQHAPCLSCIYKWHAQAKLDVIDGRESEKPGRKPDEELIKAVAEMLEQEPFASIGHMARTLNTPKSTIHRYVTKYLGRVYKHTRWVPHLLTDTQKKSGSMNVSTSFRSSMHARSLTGAIS